MWNSSPCLKKKGPPLGIGGPRRRVSIAGVVFTPARGVIHPSFPLRGRWERSAKSDKQAPSPSLVSFHISSFETPPRNPRMHGFLQCYVRTRPHKYLLMFKLALCNDHAMRQIRTAVSIRNCLHSETRKHYALITPEGVLVAWFQ